MSSTQTPIMAALEDAIEEQNLSKFMEVLESTPSPSQDELDEALTLALDPYGDIRAMIPLLSHGAKVTRNSFGSAFVRKDLVAWQAFLDYGWDINSVEFGEPALRSVVTNEEHVKWFLDHGADPNVRGKKGISPLAQATLNPHSTSIAILDLLISHGAELDPDALFYAMEPNHGGIPVMAYLIDKGVDVNVVRPKRAWKGCGLNSRTPLLHAIQCRSKEKVEFLLQRGADKTLNPDSDYPLSEIASARGCPEILELLSS